MSVALSEHARIFVNQSFEIAEFFGFETRNKYQVLNQQGQAIAYVAEQQKGIFGFLFRQFLGHWRTFDIHFFGNDRKEFMIATHPFRWFFQCLELKDVNGRYIGSIERRFAILSKSFEIRNDMGRLIFEVSSPFWRIWTFPFLRGGIEMAKVSKKWTGLGYELFSDRDNFLIEFLDQRISEDDRALVLAASIYIDLMYFEEKGNGGGLNLLSDD